MGGMGKRLRCGDRNKKVARAEGLNPCTACSCRGANPGIACWRQERGKEIVLCDHLLKEECDFVRGQIR